MHESLLPDALNNFWRRLFPGQIPERLLIAEPLDEMKIQLEGHTLVAVDAGRTDTTYTTCLHVPSIGLLVGGDAVYNGIHPYLGESDTQSRIEWISTLDKLEALQPTAVVAGHKAPANDDNRLDTVTTSARELYDAMLELYPTAPIRARFGERRMAPRRTRNRT
jgi:glyoxylase-like metal-dependent hydrolase (beta-lactamase superfamily II)